MARRCRSSRQKPISILQRSSPASYNALLTFIIAASIAGVKRAFGGNQVTVASITSSPVPSRQETGTSQAGRPVGGGPCCQAGWHVGATAISKSLASAGKGPASAPVPRRVGPTRRHRTRASRACAGPWPSVPHRRDFGIAVRGGGQRQVPVSYRGQAWQESGTAQAFNLRAASDAPVAVPPTGAPAARCSRAAIPKRACHRCGSAAAGPTSAPPPGRSCCESADQSPV